MLVFSQFAVFTLPTWSNSIYESIGWLYQLSALFFVLLPFIIVVKKWKPIIWWKIFIAIIATFLFHVFTVFIVTDKLVKWLVFNVGKSEILADSIEFPQLFLFSWLTSFILAFSPFLAVQLIYHKYTLKRFLVALGSAIVLAGLLLAYQVWIFIIGMIQFFNHFNS